MRNKKSIFAALYSSGGSEPEPGEGIALASDDDVGDVIAISSDDDVNSGVALASDDDVE